MQGVPELCSARTVQGMKGCDASWTMFCPDCARDERLCCYLDYVLSGLCKGQEAVLNMASSSRVRMFSYPAPPDAPHSPYLQQYNKGEIEMWGPTLPSVQVPATLPRDSCRFHGNHNSLPGPRRLPYATPIFSKWNAAGERKVVLYMQSGVQCFNFSNLLCHLRCAQAPLLLHAWAASSLLISGRASTGQTHGGACGRSKGGPPGSKSVSSTLDLSAALPQQAQLQQQPQLL